MFYLPKWIKYYSLGDGLGTHNRIYLYDEYSSDQAEDLCADENRNVYVCLHIEKRNTNS